MITRNFDAFSDSNEKGSKKRSFSSIDSNRPPYHVHAVAPADETLSALVREELQNAVGTASVLEGVNVTADSFYSSQGRIDPNFDDVNTNLIGYLQSKYPRARTLEMETFQLLHLARCSKEPIYASAAAIVVANRQSAVVANEDVLDRMELESGRAIMHAVARFPLQ